MKRITSVKLTAWLSWITAAILVLLPFHAFLTVWLSSLTGHYTLLRLWKEFLLVALVLGSFYILAINAILRKKLLAARLVRLIAVYFLVLLICAFGAFIAHTVTAKAMWYGLLVDSRFLIFFLAVLVITSTSGWLTRYWQKILLAPAVIVAAFAILQFLVLPNDFLKHFGYGPNTISPFETINHNIHHIRVASTLRGANPLGAYLIVPICALAVMFFKEKRERLDKTIFGLGLVLALIFSFSRSAWIGAALGILTIVGLSLRTGRAKKLAVQIMAGILVVAVVLGVLLRNNLSFEDFIFHTDRASTIAVSSNEGHSAAFRAAAKDIANQPLGGGVGTAGPESVYNSQPARIAENYFLQIGQEAGIIGLLLFIAICAETGRLLYVRRADPLALALLASLVGLSFINLLSHAWTDDTLAYIWWGLAAICLSPVILGERHKQNVKIKKTA
ncbi:MAG TPA: O-antigen ligase family protein [Candidatus Saccharimonadales bacterium]|nr:O-antigen ligase family protein [Candidatus Saccharimonadales bacterium]